MTMVLINSQTLVANASSVTFSSIPGTYYTLYLYMSARGDTAATTIPFTVQFNGSSTSLTYRYVMGSGTAASTSSGSTGQAGTFPAASAGTSVFGSAVIRIPDYANSTTNKIAMCESSTENTVAASDMTQYSVTWAPTSSVPITSIQIAATTGNIVAGSTFTLYGIF